MIFEVSPEQIERLKPNELVELLRRLLYSEARSANVAMSGVSVPLKITVPDGGEDGRIVWEGGAEKTDYLPARFCLFQAKASKLTPNSWKKEVWTRASRSGRKKRKLSKAIQQVTSAKGAYIAFTTADIVHDRINEIKAAIYDGIRQADGNPDALKSIEVYSAEMIALWCMKHPSVAIWINEQQSGLALKGFQSIENWGKRQGFSNLKTVGDKKARYVLEKRADERAERSVNALTADQAQRRISDEIKQPGISVRVYGPSGVGKTRFVFDSLSDEQSIEARSQKAISIFCDYRDVSVNLNSIISSLLEVSAESIIVVDECPRDTAIHLSEIASGENSKIRIVTVGLDERAIDIIPCLNLSVGPSDDDLSKDILRQILPKADDSDINFIAEVAQGFPRIAVLVAQSYHSGQVYKSVADIIERILLGNNLVRPSQVRAIECLSLFDRLGFEAEVSQEIDMVAEKFARMSGDEMFEHLSGVRGQSIVQREGRYLKAQPNPLAAFLGMRRLAVIRVSVLEKFILEAPNDLVFSFLTRAKYFDTSETAIELSRRLLSRRGRFGEFDTLGSEFGSKCLEALVHIAPDDAMDTIDRVFGSLSIDKLGEPAPYRRHLVWALEKLVFRKKTFISAARVLMKLSAVETENWANNATNQFERLFHIYLSGTEAPPAERLVVLDEGLESSDDRVVGICIEALGAILEAGHFSRTAGGEQIGTNLPLKDWQPKLWREVFDFYREGIRRLETRALEESRHSKACQMKLASHLRSLIMPQLFEEVATAVTRIKEKRGVWLEPIETIGDWLYFDSEGAPAEFKAKVRKFYDSLLPTSLIDRAVFYSRFWPSHIRDPDEVYKEGSHDFEYSSRMARAVAREMARKPDLQLMSLNALLSPDLHNIYPLANELGLSLDDPGGLYRQALSAAEKIDNANVQFFRAMLSAIEQKNPALARELLALSLASPRFKKQDINFYTALKITPERISEIVDALRNERIAPSASVLLSYGRGLDHLSAETILPLLDQLATISPDGIWAGLEIISMYQHGRESLDAKLAAEILRMISMPELLEPAGRRAQREGYHLEQMASLLKKCGFIDSNAATLLARQIVRLCKVEQSDVFLALDSSARTLIKELAESHPAELWNELSEFALVATPRERFWFDELVGPGRTFGDTGTDAGPLFKVPETIILNWAKDDPPTRVPFLFEFIPILIENGARKKWHPIVENIMARYGRIEPVRLALERRLYPRSWSGSRVPYLEVYLSPLEAWFAHPFAEVSGWARRMARALERSIEIEKRSDE